MTFQLPQQVNREGLFGEKGQLDMVSQSQFQVKDRGPEESEQLTLGIPRPYQVDTPCGLPQWPLQRVTPVKRQPF